MQKKMKFKFDARDGVNINLLEGYFLLYWKVRNGYLTFIRVRGSKREISLYLLKEESRFYCN